MLIFSSSHFVMGLRNDKIDNLLDTILLIQVVCLYLERPHHPVFIHRVVYSSRKAVKESKQSLENSGKLCVFTKCLLEYVLVLRLTDVYMPT